MKYWKSHFCENIDDFFYSDYNDVINNVSVKGCVPFIDTYEEDLFNSKVFDNDVVIKNRFKRAAFANDIDVDRLKYCYKLVLNILKQKRLKLSIREYYLDLIKNLNELAKIEKCEMNNIYELPFEINLVRLK